MVAGLAQGSMRVQQMSLLRAAKLEALTAEELRAKLESTIEHLQQVAALFISDTPTHPRIMMLTRSSGHRWCEKGER